MASKLISGSCQETLKTIDSVSEDKGSRSISQIDENFLNKMEPIFRNTQMRGPNFNCTDVGNAERFVHLHKSDTRYIVEFKKWIRWNGYRWCFDEDGAVMRCAKKTAETIYREAANQENEEVRKILGAWAVKSESEYRLKAMINLASSEPGIPISQCKLDADPMLLGVNNGTINLLAGTLRQSNREDFIMKRAFVDFNPDAVCPTWITFLKCIFQDNNDIFTARLGGQGRN